MIEQEIIDQFFAEYERRVADPPDPDYARRLRGYEPALRRAAAADPVRFAREIVETMERQFGPLGAS